MRAAERVGERVYRGLWGVLARWFRVPQAPPTLPAAPGEAPRSVRPSEGWLRMRKFQFWLALTIIDGLLLAVWLVLFWQARTVALWLAAPWLVLIVAPDVVAYVAIHLRYDTTWYVLGERSVRIRRGVWRIEEKTFTYENVQNVEIHQGPVQRYFGVSNLVIQTAGGGGGGTPHTAGASAHTGLIEGVHDAQEIRESIMRRVRVARGAGLGDAPADERDGEPRGFSSQHLEALREIRDLAAALASSGLHGEKMDRPR